MLYQDSRHTARPVNFTAVLDVVNSNWALGNEWGLLPSS